MQPNAVATLISSASVCVAVLFGSLTLRQWRRARSLTAATELVRTIQTPDFTRSIARVMELPPGADPQLVLGDPEMVTAIYVITHALESLGVLVYHRQLPLALVDHLIGGYVRAGWVRVEPYCARRRETMGSMFAEWFQWLAERLDEYPAAGKKLGAAVAFRDWRP